MNNASPPTSEILFMNIDETIWQCLSRNAHFVNDLTAYRSLTAQPATYKFKLIFETANLLIITVALIG